MEFRPEYAGGIKTFSWNSVPDGWRLELLGNLCSVRRGASPRPAGDPRYFGGDIPWFKIGDATRSRSRFLYTTDVFVNEEGAKCSVRIPPGSLIVSNSGVSLGFAVITGLEGCIHDGWLLLDKLKGVDRDYLYYCINQFTPRIRGMADGTTQPNLNTDIARRLLIPLPHLFEQRAIARMLASLDDRIELNRRMNATLEAMAQALFDHSFPYSTEDNLPDSWRVGRLDEVLVLQRGFDLPTPERLPGPYQVIAASGPSGTHNQFMVRGPGVTTGRSGVLGNVYFVHEDFWPLNTSLWIKEFRHATPAYAYHLLRGLDFELFNAGSAVPTLNRNHVHNLPVVVPPMKSVQDFDRAVMPLLRRQKANHEQSQTLAALRETLLPTLLSGELRVAAP
jgi:type I restriction enzyme S subunit